jgi:c-di-GMP-binding flagellar brake protein YcgR
VEINALTQDISLGGARILMIGEVFPVGSTVRMTLYLSKSRQIVKVQALVRWARTVEAGLYEMGVEFEHGIPASVMALINHLYKKDQNVFSSVQAKHAGD